MPDAVDLPKTDDPLAHIRAGVDAHRRVVDGSKAAAVSPVSPGPPPPPPTAPERPR